MKLTQETFESIEKKLKTVNPTVFHDAFLKMEVPKISYWKLLKRVWKRSKGTVIAFIFLAPFAMFLRLLSVRSREKLFAKFEKVLINSNEMLKKRLTKVKKESEKMFIETFMKLNTIAIEITPLLLEENRRIKEGKKLREIFLQEPTTENLLRLWNFIKQSFELEMRIAELKKKKADIQDQVIEYARKMTKFDKKDIEDLWRAILTDLMISSIEKKFLVVGTPIEILLKSGKIMNRIRGAFLLSQMLRQSAELTEEAQNKLMEWFITYEENS